jgi:hypothetical protein
LFGPAVKSAFPNAADDIREAGNCLAVDCNTAAVFHLMRAVELGLRAFAAHLGVRRLKSVTKGGIVHLTPVAYSQWEKILNQLPGKIEARLKRYRPGPVKHRYEQFYGESLQEISAIKSAWRNHVMHARESYSALDARAIASHVERLMVKLSTRVKEI